MRNFSPSDWLLAGTGWVWLGYWGLEFLFMDSQFAFSEWLLRPGSVVHAVGIAFMPLTLVPAAGLIGFAQGESWFRWPRSFTAMAAWVGIVALGLVFQGVGPEVVLGIGLWLVFIPLAVGYELGTMVRERVPVKPS